MMEFLSKIEQLPFSMWVLQGPYSTILFLHGIGMALVAGFDCRHRPAAAGLFTEDSDQADGAVVSLDVVGICAQRSHRHLPC